MGNNNKRPVYLDLTRIHLPVTAVLSIGHRITGVLMVLMIPLVVYLFDRSLADEQGFAYVAGLMDSVPVRAVLLVAIWILAHHFLAGLRYLLADLDIGVEIGSARISAWMVLAAGIVILFIAALSLT